MIRGPDIRDPVIGQVGYRCLNAHDLVVDSHQRHRTVPPGFRVDHAQTSRVRNHGPSPAVGGLQKPFLEESRDDEPLSCPQDARSRAKRWTLASDGAELRSVDELPRTAVDWFGQYGSEISDRHQGLAIRGGRDESVSLRKGLKPFPWLSGRTCPSRETTEDQ